MPDTTEKRFEMDIADYLLSPAGGYTGKVSCLGSPRRQVGRAGA